MPLFRNPNQRAAGLGLFGRGAASLRRSAAPSDAGIASLFAQRYGTSTPQRRRYEQPAGSGDTMAPLTGFVAKGGPKMTPEMAPVINAAAPGAFTGNPAIGFSGEEWGFGPSMGQGGRQGPNVGSARERRGRQQGAPLSDREREMIARSQQGQTPEALAEREKLNAERRTFYDQKARDEGRTGGRYDLLGNWIPDGGMGLMGGGVAGGAPGAVAGGATVKAPPLTPTTYVDGNGIARARGAQIDQSVFDSYRQQLAADQQRNEGAVVPWRPGALPGDYTQQVPGENGYVSAADAGLTTGGAAQPGQWGYNDRMGGGGGGSVNAGLQGYMTPEQLTAARDIPADITSGGVPPGDPLSPTSGYDNATSYQRSAIDAAQAIIDGGGILPQNADVRAPNAFTGPGAPGAGALGLRNDLALSQAPGGAATGGLDSQGAAVDQAPASTYTWIGSDGRVYASDSIGDMYSTDPSMLVGAGGSQNVAPGDAGSADPGGFTGAGGDFRTWDNVDWNVINNQDPKVAGDLWQQYIRYSSDPQEGFWRAYDINKPDGMLLPSFSDYKGQPINVPWDTSQGAIFDMAAVGSQIPDEGVRHLMAKMNDWSNIIHDYAQQNPGSVSTKRYGEIFNKFNASRELLARYGVTFNALGSGDGTGGTGGGTGGGTAPGGGGTGGSGGPVYGDAGNYRPGISDARSIANLGDTDLATQMPSLQSVAGDLKQVLGSIGIDISKLKPAQVLEFAQNKFLLENAMQNQQKGTNILQGQYESTLRENNPFRATSEDMMQRILANPDPVDWQGVRNRYVGDESRGLDSSVRALSASAARRGLGATDVSGLTGELFADHGSRVARGLGELTTQEQSQLRDRELQALISAGNLDRNYSGAESMAAQILSNAVMGTPTAPANPYAGLADTAANDYAIQLATDAQGDAKRAADNSMWGSAAGALFGTAGNIFGSQYGSKWLFGG